MRLIEKMWSLINAESKKDWKEKPGSSINENIKLAFEEVKKIGRAHV